MRAVKARRPLENIQKFYQSGCHVVIPGENEYTHEYIMPTSVHIPRLLLAAIDRKARALKISRNRLITHALEKDIAQSTEWSYGFIDRLREVEPGHGLAVDDMLSSILAGRKSKRPPDL